MLYVTHSEAEARRLGDHVVRIDQGRVTAEGNPAAMLPGREITGEAIRPGIARIAGTEVAIPGLDAAPGRTVRVSW
jgi:molybdate transport system ATP-binding protein